MIKIPYILKDGVITLERELTKEEGESVTSKTIDATDYNYWQGDEPPEIIDVSEKLDLSAADIDSLTDEQVQKLKIRLNS